MLFCIAADSTELNLANPYEKYYYISAQYNIGTPYTPKRRIPTTKPPPINWEN
jgi:hypothetical protein